MAPLLLRTRMFRVCAPRPVRLQINFENIYQWVVGHGNGLASRPASAAAPWAQTANDPASNTVQNAVSSAQKRSRSDRKRGGQTEPDLHRASQAEPPVDRHVPADLADAARDDAGRARRGD